MSKKDISKNKYRQIIEMSQRKLETCNKNTTH